MPDYWRIDGNGNATASSFLGTRNDVPLVFKTSDTERVRIDNRGFMGLGILPDSPLHISAISTHTNGGMIRLELSEKSPTSFRPLTFRKPHSSENDTFLDWTLEVQEPKPDEERNNPGLYLWKVLRRGATAEWGANFPEFYVGWNGRIGLGTAQPSSQLHIQSKTPDASAGMVHLEVSEASTSAHRPLTFTKRHSDKVSVLDWTFELDAGDSPGLGLWSVFRRQSGPQWGTVPNFYLSWDGNLGIGTEMAASGAAIKPEAKVDISSQGTEAFPQLKITQKTTDEFARLRFAGFVTGEFGRVEPHKYWEIAAGGASYPSDLTFRVEQVGVVMTLQTDGAYVNGNVHANRDAFIGRDLRVTGTGYIPNLVTNGHDVAETFDIRGKVDPGTVVVIDDEHPGELRISDRAYDNRVAGVVSGAGAIKPGIVLGKVSMIDANPYIALTGRVYCKADASNSPIRAGDLLTTSDCPGHAMKAADLRMAQGAIIGKAMTGLDRGQGLVLVLVSLQ